jgi:hypothetical protein
MFQEKLVMGQSKWLLQGDFTKIKMKLGCYPQQTNRSIKYTPILKRDANDTTSENRNKKLFKMHSAMKYGIYNFLRNFT